MKKRSLKSLKLNKKSISSFYYFNVITGGERTTGVNPTCWSKCVCTRDEECEDEIEG